MTILPYVRIGAGALVGAGSVVTRDVPAGTVAVGNPAVARRAVAELPVIDERLVADSGSASRYRLAEYRRKPPMTDLAERKGTTAPGRVYEMAKRTIDIMLSLALIVIVAPLLLFLCLLVRLTSAGPRCSARRDWAAPSSLSHC